MRIPPHLAWPGLAWPGLTVFPSLIHQMLLACSVFHSYVGGTCARAVCRSVEELMVSPATSPRFGDEYPELQFALLTFLPADLALPIVRRSKNPEFLRCVPYLDTRRRVQLVVDSRALDMAATACRYGAEAGLWSSGSRLVQPVDAAEHDGRTHAAVLEAVNRDGYADQDPNPLYSSGFQSNSQPQPHEQHQQEEEDKDGEKAAEKQQGHVEADSEGSDNMRSGGGADGDVDVGVAEPLLPTPIPRDANTAATPAAAGMMVVDDDGDDLFRTFSSTPSQGSSDRSQVGQRGDNVVLPAASSPLFEPQAALLHTVRWHACTHAHARPLTTVHVCCTYRSS